MSEEDNIKSDKFLFIAWSMFCIVLFTCAWILGGSTLGNSSFIVALVFFFFGVQYLYIRKFTNQQPETEPFCPRVADKSPADEDYDEETEVTDDKPIEPEQKS